MSQLEDIIVYFSIIYIIVNVLFMIGTFIYCIVVVQSYNDWKKVAPNLIFCLECFIAICIVGGLLQVIRTKDKIINSAGIQKVIEYRMPDRPPFTIDSSKPEGPKQQ